MIKFMDVVLCSLLVLNTGCVTTLSHYRGYAPTSSEVKFEGLYRVHRGAIYERYLIGRAGNAITIFLGSGGIHSRLSIELNKGHSSVILFGPFIFIPLTLIPNPFGIWKALVKHPSAAALAPTEILISLDGWEKVFIDPERVNISVDDKEVLAGFEVGRGSPTDTGDATNSEVTNGMVPFLAGTFYRFHLPPGPTPKKITVRIGAMSVGSRALELPEFNFEFGKGIRYREYPIND